MPPPEDAFIYGINPVAEYLKSSGDKCLKLVVEEDKGNARVQGVAALARARGVRVEFLSRDLFRKKYKNIPHQGVVAHIAARTLLDLDAIVERAFASAEDRRPLLILLDGIQDPQNLGAVIRSALVLGAQGVVTTKHRSAPINQTVAKAAAGAVERMPVAMVTNLAQAMAGLKEAGFWTVGADPEAASSCNEFQFDMPTALVIGGEGRGLRPLVKKLCDFTVSIPMRDSLGSLNAATATAVLCYEFLRQKLPRR